ncbi:MAG: ribosomal protein L7/L12 [Deltaproteobacteria bacterium]|nr:ribosomal protein L7/L12 [Deltaproteobacteria bacterium]
MSLDDEYEVAWDNMSDTSQFAICGLIHAGKKIAAIKLVREETQWGLKEAKQMVDSAWIHTKLGEVV